MGKYTRALNLNFTNTTYISPAKNFQNTDQGEALHVAFGLFSEHWWKSTYDITDVDIQQLDVLSANRPLSERSL